MKKIYILLILAFPLFLQAQKLSESFATSLTPPGWTTVNPNSLITRSTTVNGYSSTTNVGSAYANNYNIGNTVSTLQSPTFTASVTGDSLRFDVAHAGYPGYEDSLSVFAYNGTTYSMIAGWRTSATVDNGITTAAAQTGRFTPTGGQWRTKVLNLPVGTVSVLFRFTSGFSNDMYVDNIIVDSFYTATMTYDSSNTTQNNITGVLKGSKNQEIIGIKVFTTGNTSPLSLTNFSLSTGSSTSPSTDIDSAIIYYTGTNSAFATTNVFGGVANPNGFFSVNGSQTLAQGVNYFWVAYNVSSTATSNNFIDAECYTMTVGFTTGFPATTSPAGQRKIIGPMSGTYTVGTSGDFSNLTNAIAEINLAGLQGNTQLHIISNTTESAPVIINKWNETGVGGYSLRISPTVADTVFVNGAGGGAITLFGARNVTIDGRINGSGNNLTIMNTNTAANNAGMLVASPGSNLGCMNDTIRNVNLLAGSNLVNSIGIQVQGENNTNISIIDNVIKRAFTGVNVFTTTYPAGANSGITITGNTIGDIDGTLNIKRLGISLTNSPASLISKNNIYNIDDITSTSNIGIAIGANANRTQVIANRIDTVSNGNPGQWLAYGINVTGSDSLMIANNIIERISMVNYSTTSTTYNPFGIRITAGNSHTIAYNSVNLHGPSINNGTTGTLSAALLVTGGTNLIVRNNIFSNSYLGTAGSTSYSIYSTISSPSPFGVINNNNYAYSGTYGMLGYMGSARTTLAAWRTATTQDALSVSANPFFTNNEDLTINSGATANQMESGGAVLAGITTDYNGDARPKTTPTTYGGNTAPDMGAIEFDGQPIDLTAPLITYTGISNTQSTANRVLTSFATITDASGINTLSPTNPRIYFKKTSNNNTFGTYPADNNSTFNGWKYVEATNTTSPFSFTIDNSLLTGGAVAVSDTIQYFVVAQDMAGTPNISSNPGTGFTATSINTITSAPTTPGYYIITPAPLAGIYQVGSGQQYTTLTAAVNDLTLRGVNAPVILNLTDASYSSGETFPIIISKVDGASGINTITIKPGTGVNAVISGSSATSIIRLEEASYININGSNNSTTSRNLRISNTNTAGSVIHFASLGSGKGSTNDTIANTVITGNSVTSATVYGIFIGSTTIGTSGADNNNISIINDSITYVGKAIFALGSNAISGLNVSNNTIGHNIAANSIYNVGIEINNASSPLVFKNKIFNVKSTATALNGPIGIRLLSTSNATITKNNIMGVAYTGTSGYSAKGIDLFSGNSNATIDNNMLSDIYGDGDGSDIIGYNIFGITLRTGSGHQVRNNSIWISGNRLSNSYTDAVAAGIYVGSAMASLDVRNNIILNTQTSSNASAGSNYGVYSLTASTGFAFLDNNNYFISSATPAVTKAIGYISGANQVTLANWRTATGSEINSANDSVQYVSLTNLHLAGTSIGNTNYIAAPIAAITTDIDDETRNALYPYMGADENTSSPLPVEFDNLTADKLNQSALLKWSTVSETNNAHFIIERSIDAVNFEAISEVKGAGNSKRKLNYMFVDNDAAKVSNNNTVYYRLRQVDFNGKSALSKVVSVQFNGNKSAIVNAYPNPVSDVLSVSFESLVSGNMEISITDVHGKQVLSGSAPVTVGHNSSSVNVNMLDAGIYFIKTIINGTALTQKIVKY